MKTLSLILSIVLFGLTSAFAQTQVLPPTPKLYFNDYAEVTSTVTQHILNERLAKFDKDTTNQVVVAIFPQMTSTLDERTYTLQLANSWGVGQRDKANGVVLFVFVKEKRMRIQVGKGLTSTLTDELSNKIVDQDMKPHMARGDFNGGLTVGVDAILKSISEPTPIPTPSEVLPIKAKLGDTEQQSASHFTTKPIKVVALDDKTHINVYHENRAFFFNVISNNTCVMEAVWANSLCLEVPYDIVHRWKWMYEDDRARALRYARQGNEKDPLPTDNVDDGWWEIESYPEHGLRWSKEYMGMGHSLVPSCVIIQAVQDAGTDAWSVVFCVTGSFMYPTSQTRDNRLVEGPTYQAAFNKIWEIRGDLETLEHQTPGK